MKVILVTLIVMISSVLAEDKYDSSNDNFDLSKVLDNDRLLISYSKCLLDKGPCTPDVKKLKDRIPEVLETRCAKCSDKQVQLGRQVVKAVKTKQPDMWKQLVAKFDPQGKYQDSFKDLLQEN